MFREKEVPKRWFISNKVEMKYSDIHGRGVFAKERIEKLEVIESAPVVIAHVDTMSTLNEFCCSPGTRHIFMDYVFSFGPGKIAFPMGWAGIYNHDNEPNAFWDVISEEPLVGYSREVDAPTDFNALIFRAKRVIEPGEEICTRYTPFADQLWFTSEDDIESAGHFDPYASSMSRPVTAGAKFSGDLKTIVKGAESSETKTLKDFLK